VFKVKVLRFRVWLLELKSLGFKVWGLGYLGFMVRVRCSGWGEGLR
jgi:hypothetical protein